MADKLTVEQAREAHEQCRPYAVCQMENEELYAVATFDDKKVVVYFLTKGIGKLAAQSLPKKNRGAFFFGWRLAVNLRAIPCMSNATLSMSLKRTGNSIWRKKTMVPLT